MTNLTYAEPPKESFQAPGRESHRETGQGYGPAKGDPPIPGAWAPLLTGGLARRSRSCLRQIAGALADLRPATPSYAGGSAGLALFFGYLAADLRNESALDLASEHLCRAVEGIDQASLGLSLHNGLVGIAWTMRHLEALLGGETSPGLTEEVDSLLLDALHHHPWRREMDLTYGLVGLGVYALDHSCPNRRRSLLRAVLEHLESLRVEIDDGIAWPTSPRHLAPEAAQRFPDGFYNMGIAHGTPGVIGLLARTVAERQGGELAMRLLEGSIRWLLRQRRPGDGGSAFPYSLPEGRSSRSAWCHGDPGIAAIVLAAARARGSRALERQAAKIAAGDSRRPRRESGVVDAGLCHGAAGLGHLYNRLYQSTRRPALADTARFWLSRALAFRRAGRGIAGFASFWPESGQWRDQPGLLDGAAGVGLALLAATSAIEPSWDRPLLIALAPTRAESSPGAFAASGRGYSRPTPPAP